MLVDVEAFLFDAWLHADAVDLVKHFEGEEAEAESPDYGDCHAERLYSEEMGSVAIEQAVLGGEQTRQYGAEDAAALGRVSS